MGRRRTEARKQKTRGKVEHGAERGATDRRGRSASPDNPMDPGARSRKVRAKGDSRRALVLLRQTCALDEWRARTWTLLGAYLGARGRGRRGAARL